MQNSQISSISNDKFRQNDEKFSFDICLVLGEYRKNETIKLAKSLNAKRIIVPFSLKLCFQNGFDTLFYHQLHKHREVWRSVQLVRHIDKRHFDANIAKIDFSKITLKTLPEHKKRIDEFFAPHSKFTLKVGINAFGNTFYRFQPQDYALVARHLSRKFPKVLFVMMNFHGNCINFKPFNEENIVIFENDDKLLNLIEFTRRLDFLITPDTGNVHIADILRVPILQTIRRDLRLKWGGGSFDNACEMLFLSTSWIKKYTKLRTKFTKMAENMIEKMLNLC